MFFVVRMIFRDERDAAKCKIKCRRFWTCFYLRNKPPNRPLYRDDIFYSQSVHKLPNYAKTKEKKRALSVLVPKNAVQEEEFQRKMKLEEAKYHMSVTRVGKIQLQRKGEKTRQLFTL